MKAEKRIVELGVTLPPPSAPAGNYTTAVRTGNLLYLSGKAPSPVAGVAPKGKLGQAYTAADGYALARSAGLELIGAIRSKLGSLDRVVQIVELHGSLNTTPEFEEHAKVLDGASDLLAEVFGPAGVHARSVVGVSSLRNGVPLTLKAIVEISPGDAG